MLRTSPLLKAGLTVKVSHGKLIISPKEKLNKETRSYITAFKQEIIKELTPLPLNNINKVWLAKIAKHLNVSSEFLLDHKFIDEYDLKELININPIIVVNSIKTNPRWITIAKPVYEDEQIPAIEDITELAEQVKVNPCFNTLIDHLMRSKGTCCYAPANRYCDIGRDLKASYEDSYNSS